jgi:predicted ATP-dependent protease
MAIEQFKVPDDKLRWECDPKIFDFTCTKDLSPLREFIGQERAIRAIDFGLNMVNAGYNIYVAGTSGTGKTSMVKAYIARQIKKREEKGEQFTIEDYCYLYNFKEPDRPKIVSLPQSKGKQLREQVNDLLERLKQELGRAFSSEDYKNQRQRTLSEGQSEQQRVFEEIAKEARHQGFALQMTPAGPILIPLVQNRPMEQTEFLALDERARKKLEDKQSELLEKLRDSFEKASNMQQQLVEKLKKMDRAIGEYTVNRLFGALLEEYVLVEKVKNYLEDLKGYVLDNLETFKGTEEPVNPLLGVPTSQLMGGRDVFLPFRVNIFVDNSETVGPPVVTESNPIFGNVFGKIERRFLLGGYLSDHTMLKAGALSLANNGYLLLNALDVLINPGVWPALKRAIRYKEVRIEDPYEQFGFIAPQGLRPEPMPIKIKIVLIGDSQIYQALSQYDEDFWELFKVKADFDYEINKSEQNMKDYAAFLAGCCEECEVRHFDPSGVAKIIEYSSRAVEDQERLSSRFAQIKEWIEEANYWAEQEKSQYISAKHVQKAIDERFFRHNLVDEHIRDMIRRGTIMIDVDGDVAGQVNGLSVYSLGDVSFGRPSRITAKTFLGRSGIINIERESEMSGPIHNKGVMILSGYLGWKYAQDKPLSLSASLCFEQSYEGVEGDSASSTELYAILSSLSGVPIKQNFAVTGSVNQRGEIQPIGGVNQKIEGFFRVCQAKGLTGQQAVLIPSLNISNLMLREEVVEAVRNKKFAIYSAKTIDEGIEILTGVPAGQKQSDGTYPENTVNYLVDKRLREMAEQLKTFYSEEKEEKAKRKI